MKGSIVRTLLEEDVRTTMSKNSFGTRLSLPAGDGRVTLYSLPELARSLGLQDRVIFTGHLPDIRPALAALDVFVHPGSPEPFGLVNIEAVTADMNDFRPDGRFDRVISVEMFEHMRNVEALLDRLADGLAPGEIGRAHV